MLTSFRKARSSVLLRGSNHEVLRLGQLLAAQEPEGGQARPPPSTAAATPYACGCVMHATLELQPGCTRG